MNIDIKTIERIANLVRLNLTDKEKEKMAVDMTSILNHADKLKELDTTNIQPMEHLLPTKNVLRDDVSVDSYDRNVILKNAPSHDGCYFKVPNVME